MTRYFFLIVACLLLQSTFHNATAQPTFKYGFGGGVNFASISEINSYPLFEDITGNEYSSNYSGMFSNIGSQFFFHSELLYDNLILALKPGVYTYKFKKTDQILFNTEPVEQTNAYLLRYFQIPFEVKYMLGTGNFKPFLGASVAYGHLLQQGGEGTHSFIHPKIVASPIAGAYYSLSSFDIAFTAGYNFALHSITHEADRYNTGSNTPYAQSDIKLNDLFISISVLFSVVKNESKGALDCPSPKKIKLKKVKRK